MLRSCCRAACRAASAQWRVWGPEVVVPAGGVQQPPPPWHSRHAAPPHTGRGISTSAARHGIEDFLDTGRKAGEYPKAGRGWDAEDLRRKSFDDLHKLWYVLLKERNMLATERAAARTARDRFLNPLRLGKVRKSMARIKLVLTERAIEEHAKTGDFLALAEAKARINQL